MHKFESEHFVDNYQVMTEDGWEDVSYAGKTVEYTVWYLELSSGKILECADDHIVIREDGSEIYVKDLEEGDLLRTEDGIDAVVDVYETNKSENMYDFQVESDEHTYYTNGILSHNTLALENMAVNAIRNGLDVVYVTLELSEDEIAKRIDGKFTGIAVNDLTDVPDMAMDKLEAERNNDENGQLIIKEFPPNYTPTDVKFFLEEIEIKREYEPDLLIIDYMGEMSPSPGQGGDNSYTNLKSVIGELRSIGIERRIPVLTAAQMNRNSYSKEKGTLGDIAESMGIANRADFTLLLYTNDELERNDQLGAYVLKNRFGRKYHTFTLQVDYDTLEIIGSEEEAEDEKINRQLKKQQDNSSSPFFDELED